MVKFISIRIQDYRSIGDITLQLEPGIYKVVGESQGYSSNGAGKTSITQAIVLGLFNKDFTSAKLDELSNRITGRGFKITIQLIKDDEPYTIINDRHNKKFLVLNKGVKVASGAKDGVLFVAKLLGMGYETFCLTHFITSRTVNHITENLSNPSLFNDILQISQLKELDKRVMLYSQTLSKEIEIIEQELSNAKDLESRRKIEDKYNLQSLNEQLASIKEQKRLLTLELTEESTEYTPKITVLSEGLQDINQKIKDLESLVASGVCPTCATLLVKSAELDEFNQELSFYLGKQTDVNSELTELKIAWSKIEREVKSKIQSLNDEQRVIETNITIAEELNLAIDKIAGRSVESILEELNPKKKMQSLLYFIRKSIKDGVIVKELLSTFFEIVQVKMNDYAALINMNDTEVKITVNKLGMGIALTKKGEFVPVSTLSNGERTRLSILLLVSMLDAMKEVSNSETNYLVFDEASASFDASGIDELEKLFTYMKGLGQSSFVITHGEEMNKVHFDYTLTVRKQEGISYV